MEIGIIVYSNTGHTLKVARTLEEALAPDDHAVTLEELETTEAVRVSNTDDVELKNNPSIEGYDGLVFAAPVWGGQPASPISIYLEQLPSLERKKVVCLATRAFPRPLGRKQTIQKMKGICEAKGATDPSTGVVYRKPGGEPAMVWELMNDVNLVEDHAGPGASYTRPGQFRAAGVANYFCWDRHRYDYAVTGLNDYYLSILTMSNRGWPGGLRWLYGEGGR